MMVKMSVQDKDDDIVVAQFASWNATTITPCPEKRGHGFFGITLTNVDTVSSFLAWTISRIHFSKNIENLFLILSHHYVVMT